jgi:hypothetical protein
MTNKISGEAANNFMKPYVDGTVFAEAAPTFFSNTDRMLPATEREKRLREWKAGRILRLLTSVSRFSKDDILSAGVILINFHFKALFKSLIREVRLYEAINRHSFNFLQQLQVYDAPMRHSVIPAYNKRRH